MPTLVPTASLWTLNAYPDPGWEWTLEQKIHAAREAGFAAIQAPALTGTGTLSRDCGLGFLAITNAGPEDFSERLAEAAQEKAARINILFCRFDTPIDLAAETWVRIEKQAADLGIAPDLEIHRGTCTESPEKTAALLDRISQVTGRLPALTLDFSHWGVLRHFEPAEMHDVPGEHIAWLRHCREAHLRPFSGQHTQIPVTRPDGTRHPAYTAWIGFARAFFGAWKESAPADATLYACPELGGHGTGYWIEGFPDPWTDACAAMKDLTTIWNEL